MKVELNIGTVMNNGHEYHDVDQVREAIHFILDPTSLNSNINSRVSTDSHGDWGEEKTIVVEVDIMRGNFPRRKLIESVRHICHMMSQDAIAVYIPDLDHGELIWNGNYTGGKYEFNLNYFTRYRL